MLTNSIQERARFLYQQELTWSRFSEVIINSQMSKAEWTAGVDSSLCPSGFAAIALRGSAIKLTV